MTPGDVWEATLFNMRGFQQGVAVVIRELGYQLADEGFSYLLAEQIATDSGVCVEKVMRAIDFLASRGVITVHHGATNNPCLCAACRARSTSISLIFDEDLDYDTAVRAKKHALWIEEQAGAPPKQTRGSVYLIKSGPRYKIGKTYDVKRRMDALRTQAPFPLELIHSAEGIDNSAMESHLHATYAGERVHGEWFELADDQVQAIIATLNEWQEAGDEWTVTS